MRPGDEMNVRRGVWLLAIGALVLASCASDPEVVDESVTDATPEEETSAAAETRDEATAESSAGPLEEDGVATFVTRTGASFSNGEIVDLPTGGPAEGQLIPSSSRSDVTLYVTRDGSVPSASNNWGGPIAPGIQRVISRPLEGAATYRVAAELDGEYSDPFTLVVIWTHEEGIELAAPEFRVAGSPVRGSIELPVSDGEDESARLEIASDYGAATLYITRDGSDPSVDNFWRSQLADGTFIFSPGATAAEYRVIAIWQGSQSPVQSISVEWVE